MQRDMQYCDLFASSQRERFELTLPLLMNTLMNYFTRTPTMVQWWIQD